MAESKAPPDNAEEEISFGEALERAGFKSVPMSDTERQASSDHLESIQHRPQRDSLTINAEEEMSFGEALERAGFKSVPMSDAERQASSDHLESIQHPPQRDSLTIYRPDAEPGPKSGPK